MNPRFPIGDETQWFVFTNDRQSGPFQTADLANGLNSGDIAPNCHVWTQGLEDWQPVDQIPGLENYRLDIRSFERAGIKTTRDSDLETDRTNMNNALALPDAEFLSAGFSSSGEESASRARPDEVVQQDANFASFEKTVGDLPVKQVVKHRVAIVCGLAVLVTFLMTLVFSTDRNPAIPSQQVSASDYQELRLAMSRKLVDAGPAAAIAISLVRPETPLFFVASNVSEGSQLELTIEGVPESMVGRFFYSMKSLVTIRNGMAQSGRLTEPGQAAMLPGLYKVAVRVAGSGISIAEKTFFLGPNNNGDYQRKLKAYHADLHVQAAAEAIELRQLVDTAARHLADSASWFAKFNRTAQSKSHDWQGHDKRFREFDSQLAAIETGWTADFLERKAYYSTLYRELKTALLHIRNFHTLQGHYVKASRSSGPGGSSDSSIDPLVQISRESLLAQTGIQSVQNSLDQIAKHSTSPPASGPPFRSVP